MPDREKVIEALEMCEKKDCTLCPYKDEKDETYSGLCEQVLKNDALVLLKEQNNCENCAMAIEDRQLVVRCKDCEHQGNRCIGIYCMFIECKKTGSVHRENWFCADGERQEGR